MTDTARQILFGLVAPVVIALVCVWPRRSATGRTRGSVVPPGLTGSWRIPLAVALAVMVAMIGIEGWPANQWHYVMYVPLAALPVAIAMSMTRGARASGLPLRAGRPHPLFAIRAFEVVILAFLTTLAIWPNFHPDEPGWYRAIPAAGTIMLMAAFEPLALRRPAPGMCAALALAGFVAAAVVFQSGFMGMALILGAVGFALATAAAVGLLRKTITFADGANAVIAPVFVAATLISWLNFVYNEDATTNEVLISAAMILAIASPAALWSAELRIVRNRPRFVRIVIPWSAFLILCTLAVAMTFMTVDESAADDPYSQLYES